MNRFRICYHWSAGSYGLSKEDHAFYHFSIGPTGIILPGRFKPEDNIPPLIPGKYAMHCGGGNSNTIGISLRGMRGYRGNVNQTEFPLTRQQCESAWRLGAELAFKYNIPIHTDSIYTHRTFGLRNPQTNSRGKIDICVIPHEPHLRPDQIDNYILNKIQWYYNRLKG